MWIAEHFREEHRAALEWLNTHTDPSIRFFVAVGGSSRGTSLRGSFTVTGGIRIVDANRVLTTPVEVVHEADAAES